MQTNAEEAAQLRRADTLARARRLCNDWAYWCLRTNVRTGYEPTMSTGGIEKNYRAPPQWHPAEPRLPDADENVGLAVQRAYIHLPDKPYRRILRAHFCLRPWIIGLEDGEKDVATARRATVSLGAYEVTLTRALLALANVMKRMGTWNDGT